MASENNLKSIIDLFSERENEVINSLSDEELENLKDLIDKHSSKEEFIISTKTQKFLSNLRPADINDLQDVLNLFKTLKTVSKFVRWIFIVLISTFVAAASLGDYFSKAVKWLFGLH